MNFHDSFGNNIIMANSLESQMKGRGRGLGGVVKTRGRGTLIFSCYISSAPVYNVFPKHIMNFKIPPKLFLLYALILQKDHKNIEMTSKNSPIY